ncbi:hypothetical protein V6Z11_D05G059600 [Gossypium hirsutum]
MEGLLQAGSSYFYYKLKHRRILQVNGGLKVKNCVYAFNASPSPRFPQLQSQHN